MTSEACVTRAPVQDGYAHKGTYDNIAGLNTYVVGPRNASKGIINVYDIFGFAPQTLRGADLLSELTGAMVLVPDFFDGQKINDGVPQTDPAERKVSVQKFIQGPAKVEKNVERLLSLRAAVVNKFPSTKDQWGVFGLCWGGKIAVLACGKGNEGAGRRFNVSGTAHPGMLAEEDAHVQTAPHILLASPDESAEVVAKYKEILSQPGYGGEVETYESMFHGWMGARSNLEEEKNFAEFRRGYEQVARFFSKHL